MPLEDYLHEPRQDCDGTPALRRVGGDARLRKLWCSLCDQLLCECEWRAGHDCHEWTRTNND